MLAPLVSALVLTAGIEISQGSDAVSVSTGPYRFVLSKSAFDVVHAGFAQGQQRLFPGASSVEFLGSKSAFGPPEETKAGTDWVEMRGWADRSKHLWWVARYQFYPEAPRCRMVVTLTDRHDPGESAFAWYQTYLDKILNRLGLNRPVRTGGPWDDYWAGRRLSDWNLAIGAKGETATEITQHNSYSASATGEPWIDVVGASGSPFEWSARPDDKKMQLVHYAGDGANRVVYHPSFVGRARLAALYSGFPSAEEYKIAKALSYDIQDAASQVTTRVVSQALGPNEIPLGTFDLGPASSVTLRATGTGVAIAGSLRVEPLAAGGGQPFEIAPGRRHDAPLSSGPVTIAVKDFWEHHPISLWCDKQSIGWKAIRTASPLAGGMGLTIEMVVSMEGPAAATAALLREPPERRMPSWMHPADGTTAGGAVGKRYDALLGLFVKRLSADIERTDSFGWRSWGDYQIGMSYSKGPDRTQDWANLQYDLPQGLLLVWLRTGDPEAWRFAQASMRHLMDIDYVKFSPYAEKLNNLVHRKGETSYESSHTTTEPVVDQCFAFRSLLLYHALTGEEWARDLAKENIDRLAYYGRTRPRFVLMGDRPASWMLRGALAGVKHFPAGAAGYRQVADGLVAELMAYYRANGKLPGAQPVWQGQMVESLGQYHDLTGRQDVADAIVAHVRHMLTDAVRQRPDGHIEFLYCFNDGAGLCRADEWVDEYNYSFLWLGAVAEAYKVSHDPFFATWGERLFGYGESRLKNETGPRQWTGALAFPSLYVDTFGSR